MHLIETFISDDSVLLGLKEGLYIKCVILHGLQKGAPLPFSMFRKELIILASLVLYPVFCRQ